MLRARLQITCQELHLAVPSRDGELQDAALFGTVLCISQGDAAYRQAP